MRQPGEGVKAKNEKWRTRAHTRTRVKRIFSTILLHHSPVGRSPRNGSRAAKRKLWAVGNSCSRFSSPGGKQTIRTESRRSGRAQRVRCTARASPVGGVRRRANAFSLCGLSLHAGCPPLLCGTAWHSVSTACRIQARVVRTTWLRLAHTKSGPQQLRYCPQNVCKLQSSYICGEIKNQIKNNEAYNGTKIGNYFRNGLIRSQL